MKYEIKKQKDPFKNLIEDMFYGLSDISSDLNRAFDYPIKSIRSVGHVNLMEKENEFLVEVVAPGFQKDDLEINLDESVMTIKGKCEKENEEKNKNYFKKEFTKSSFNRSFIVPDNISGDIDANLENGILKIILKKKEIPPKPEPKRIEIK